MRGFTYLDVLFASFFALVAIVIGIQLISNVISSNHSSASNLQESVLSVSNRVIYTCYGNGGISYCDSHYVRVGIIDERALSGFEFSKDVLDYGTANNYTFRIAFDNEKISGVYCLIRLLKHKDNDREVIVRICGE